MSERIAHSLLLARHTMCLRGTILVVLLALAIENGASGAKLVVGYYPSWNRDSYPHTSILYKNLTHIAHAFVVPRGDGSIEVPYRFLYPELIQASHQQGVKVVVSVGGGVVEYASRFSAMAADTAARARFVQDLTSFCIANGYDGADIDWEFPGTRADKANMSLLIHELRQAFNTVDPPLSLSMAAPATNYSGQWYDFTTMKDDFDWIGIMTYDYYGSWTSKSGPNAALFGELATNTEGWVDYSVDYYSTTRGMQKQKLLVGIPFYGWVFNASAMYGASSGASQLTYTDVDQKLQQGWARYWDTTGQVPYIVNQGNTQVISFDDTSSIAAKCAYIKTKGVAGAIIWALGEDLVRGQQPLLTAVGQGLGSLSGVSPLITDPAPKAFTLLQNFPNPFNSQTRIRYRITEGDQVSLRLYDVLGRELRTLADGFRQPGEYEVAFSSEDIATGVYVYRLTWHGGSASRTLVVLR